MGGNDIGITWNDIIRANLTWTCWSRVFIFSTFGFLSSFFFLSALNTAEFKMSWPSRLWVINCSKVKLLEAKLGDGLDAAFAHCIVHHMTHRIESTCHNISRTRNRTKYPEKKDSKYDMNIGSLTPCCHWFIVTLMRYWILIVTIIRLCRLHRTS